MRKDEQGLTLLELLVSISILGIIVTGLYQALGTSISSYDIASNKQDLLAQARYTMGRMAMFVQECDQIAVPDSETAQEVLRVNERLQDSYGNAIHAYSAGGDGLLDADNDGDGIVNEDDTAPDPVEWITFDLDKSDPTNWKLREMMPDYSTGTLDDYRAQEILCENVKAFHCKLLASNLVEIGLGLNNGGSEVSLKTRIKARFMD
jgi:prepilin-type N-terminal cleavage/methylation domain-containing protein